jgi:hypothetical protein
LKKGGGGFYFFTESDDATLDLDLPDLSTNGFGSDEAHGFVTRTLPIPSNALQRHILQLRGGGRGDYIHDDGDWHSIGGGRGKYAEA